MSPYAVLVFVFSFCSFIPNSYTAFQQNDQNNFTPVNNPSQNNGAPPTINFVQFHEPQRSVPPRNNSPSQAARDSNGSSGMPVLDDLIRAFDGEDSEGSETRDGSRSSARDYDNPIQSPPQPLYPMQGNIVPIVPPQQSSYPVPGSVLPSVQTVSHNHPSFKTIPLATELFKPFASKVSTKLNGILGIILALLGAGGIDGSLTGLKDVIVNGIIKPLFLIKGGLKVIIAKLAIPLISLMLINLEVLFTIWWLWEDCGVVKPAAYVQPAYVPPPSQPAYIQPSTAYVQQPTYQYSKPVYSSNSFNPY